MPIAATGPISTPKSKLAEVLSQSAALQAWFGESSAAAALQRIYYTMLRADNEPELRPFAVIELSPEYSYEKFSGGGANYLSAKNGALLLTLIDNDRYPEDIHDGDTFFENQLGAVITDLAAQAAVDDKLTTSRISFDQVPARNDPSQWKLPEGAYIWCRLKIAWGDVV